MVDEEPRNEQPEEDETTAITAERVLEVLENGEMVTEHGMLRWSSNYTFLVSVRYDGLEVPAVYKPQRGERPLWDFPNGTLCMRETAAFATSQALGWNIVPPTSLREGVRGLGSVQFYIQHDPNENYFSFDESLLPQLARLSLFDAVVNNADRKGGHCLLDPTEHLWGIDHGIAFHHEHKLRTVIWDFAGQPIPDILVDDLQTLCGLLANTCSDYYQTMSKLLNEREVRALIKRVDRLLASGKYPTPGPGPNYPWPAV